MKPATQDDSAITQKASEWFFALPNADAGAQAAFGAWLKESPRHVAEFLLISAAYQELDGAAARSLDVEALHEAAAANVVVPLQDSAPRPFAPSVSHNGKKSRSGKSRALAAAAAVVIAVGWLLWATGGQSYSTAVGEIRSFALADGSVIQLNTRSRVKVDYSDGARDVQLISGEALFKVARDPARPFRVYAGNATIQALGTEFNVYRRARGAKVSVLEGAVRISEVSASPARTLAAGQEANISLDGKITQLAAADTAKAIAWQQRRLVFRGEPLEEVAAEFNRYNRTPQLRVQGELARKVPLAGIFDADDPESLLLFLSTIEKLETERHADEVLIRDR